MFVLIAWCFNQIRYSQRKQVWSRQNVFSILLKSITAVATLTILPTLEFVVASIFLLYLTVRVVFSGAIPKALFEIKFLGSKVVSVTYDLPNCWNVTAEGSGTLFSSTVFSDPCPNTNTVFAKDFSVMNLLGTGVGISNEGDCCLVD